MSEEPNEKEGENAKLYREVRSNVDKALEPIRNVKGTYVVSFCVPGERSQQASVHGSFMTIVNLLDAVYDHLAGCSEEEFKKKYPGSEPGEGEGEI